MGKRRPTARSASSSRRSRSPISMASEAARDASLRPNSHPDRNLRPCKTMHPLSVESQCRFRPDFRRFSLQRAAKERSVRPVFRQANRWAKGRTGRSEQQKPNTGIPKEKLRRFSACRTKRLAEVSRRGRKNAEGSRLQFQERGFSPRQFPMRARAQDSTAQSCLGNEQQAALQKLQEVERSGGSEPGSVVTAAPTPR